MMALEEGDDEALLTARWLHERGFHLVPCGSPLLPIPKWFLDRCGGDQAEAASRWPKTPLVGWKEFQERQPTDQEMDAWERRFPHCNWALITGQSTGVVALDGDDPESVEFLNSGRITRAVWVSETPRGEHHLYRPNPDAPWKTGVGETHKLDVRGNGGYIIAPGSMHASGQRYRLRIADGYSDDPSELTMLTARDQAEVHAFNGKVERNSGLFSGPGNLAFDATQVAPRVDFEDGVVGKGRNSRTNQLTGSLITAGKSLREILEIVKDQNARNLDERGRANPLSEGELLTTVASTIRTHLDNNPDKPVPLEPGTNVQAAVARELRPKLHPIEASELQARPIKPVEWVWEGWIPKGYTTGCFAEGGTGKSQAFLQLAVCRAAQVAFIDGNVPAYGKTLLLFCEDDIDIVNGRLQRILQRYNLTWESIKGSIYILCRVGEDNYLMTFDQKDVGALTPFWYQIHDLIEDLGVDLLVVDTRGDVFAGQEINNSQARQFVQRCLTSLAQKFSLAAVFLAHVSVQGKASGSGLSGGNAWRDTARAQIYMHRENPQSQKVTFDLMKSNHAASGTEVETWIDGGFLLPAAQIDLATKMDEQSRLDFLAILERQRRQEQYYSLHKQSKEYAPLEFSRISNQLRKWKTTSVSAFEKAMEELMESGLIVRWADDAGRVKHRVWRPDWDTETEAEE